jgi:hypothetical protein
MCPQTNFFQSDYYNFATTTTTTSSHIKQQERKYLKYEIQGCCAGPLPNVHPLRKGIPCITH